MVLTLSGVYGTGSRKSPFQRRERRLRNLSEERHDLLDQKLHSTLLALVPRLQIEISLRDHPAAAGPSLPAIETFVQHGPAANRPAIATCCARSKRLASQLVGVGDGKHARTRVVASAADWTSVTRAGNHLCGKEAHGGNSPSRDEAECGLRTGASSEHPPGAKRESNEVFRGEAARAGVREDTPTGGREGPQPRPG